MSKICVCFNPIPLKWKYKEEYKYLKVGVHLYLITFYPYLNFDPMFSHGTFVSISLTTNYLYQSQPY